MLRFCDDTFDQHINSTIGVDFKVKLMNMHSKRIKLTIWDTAGQERFRTLTQAYYRGAQGVILVYDVTRQDSFENLDRWLQEMEVYCPGGGREVVKLLVGNKIDQQQVVQREDVEEWARSRGMIFLESSAKTSVGIQQAFQEVVEKILENPNLLVNTGQKRPTKEVDLKSGRGQDGASQQGGGACC